MLINSLLFNIAWLGCVLLGNSFAFVVVIWAMWHVFLDEKTRNHIPLLITITIIGTTTDSLLMHAGVLVFQEPSKIVPFWLIMIWLAFSMTINGYLKPLQNHRIAQCFLGLFVVPLSYLGGHALSAVSFTYPTATTFIIFSILWGALLPLFFYMNQKFNKVTKYENSTLVN